MPKSTVIPPTPGDRDYRESESAVPPVDPAALETDAPIALFEAWLAEASAHEPNDPNAMTVATADADGTPNARILLLKDVDARGFTFFSNAESAKGLELAARPQAALCFHWKSLRRQVRVRGPVAEVEPEEVDAYFASRARVSRIGAWASRQSRPLDSRAALEAAVAEREAAFEGGDVPRPPHWTGYRLAPVAIEFWADRPYRLHERMLFTRAAPQRPWTRTRLYP